MNKGDYKIIKYRLPQRFPENAVAHYKGSSGYAHNHEFCYHCGKELTKFNRKTGNLSIPIHKVVVTDDGTKLKLCDRNTKCNKRREAWLKEKETRYLKHDKKRLEMYIRQPRIEGENDGS